MEDHKVFKKEKTKRYRRSFCIGAAVAVILLLLFFGYIRCGGVIDPYLFAMIYYVISWPARAIYAIAGRELYPDSTSSLIVLLTSSFLAGLIGGCCGIVVSFISRNWRSL